MDHPPIPSLAGQTLGNWNLLRQLGEGSFGAVYEAQHQAIAQRRAAVKVLHPHLSTDAVVQRLGERRPAGKAEHQSRQQQLAARKAHHVTSPRKSRT